MKLQEFITVAQYIRTCYPKEEKLFSDQAQVVVWYDFFKEYTFDEVYAAVKSVVRNCKFSPTIAEITAELEKNNTAPDLTPSEAWQIVARTISQYGRNRGNEAFDDLLDYEDGERILKAVKSCGWQYLCNEDEAKAKRAFVAEYKEQGGTVKIRMLEGSA